MAVRFCTPQRSHPALHRSRRRRCASVPLASLPPRHAGPSDLTRWPSSSTSPDEVLVHRCTARTNRSPRLLPHQQPRPLRLHRRDAPQSRRRTPTCCLAGHEGQCRRAVEHQVARPIRLNHGVAVPHHVEVAPLRPDRRFHPAVIGMTRCLRKKSFASRRGHRATGEWAQVDSMPTSDLWR